MTSPFVSVDWLKARLQDENIVILDATWTMPGSESPLPGSYIPSAQAFDIDDVADLNSPFAHTLPSAAVFEDACNALAITNGSAIIVYDRHGLFSAPRAWWMFRVFGHDKVKVLDGGLPAWIASGGDTETGPANPEPTSGFSARLRPELVADKAHVLNQLNKAIILDARPSGRFEGRLPEPRAGLQSGHMPGAHSMPFGTLKTDDNLIKDADELSKVFSVLDNQRPIITSCGSGITACGLAIALAHAGHWDVRVYDGSWAEWASDPNMPIEVDR